MKQELLQIYLKYKKQILPLVFIILSIFTIFRIILPQLFSISGSTQGINERKQELETLTDSIKVLEAINDNAISEDLALSSDALPTSKDITKIFSALTSAARSSNSELREFSLKVGGVFGKPGSEVASPIGVPELFVVAKISSSDNQDLINFAQKLTQTLPLSEIKKIEASDNLGTFDISFYYKPLDLNLILKNDRVVPLSQGDRNLLNQLSGWSR